MSSHHSNRGFTLLETMLYLSLSVLAASLVLDMNMNLLSQRRRALAYGEMLYNTELVLHQTHSMLVMASEIIAPEPGQTDTTLAVRTNDGIVLTFTQSDEGFVATHGDHTTLILSPTYIRQAQFTRQDTTGSSPWISVSLETTPTLLSSSVPETLHQFQTSMQIRNE